VEKETSELLHYRMNKVKLVRTRIEKEYLKSSTKVFTLTDKQ